MNQNHLCYHYTTREKFILSRLFGGDDRVRTDDPHNAIVVLFQLSYIPKNFYPAQSAIIFIKVNVFLLNMQILFILNGQNLHQVLHSSAHIFIMVNIMVHNSNCVHYGAVVAPAKPFSYLL